jgi:dipeptide/tripeptide permease
MALQSLARWSGPTLMLGGLLLAIHYLTHPLGETPQYILSGIWEPTHFIGAVAWVLILVGTAGFYSQYSGKLGRLGSVGFLLAFVGGANRPGELLVVGTVIGPLIAAQAPSLLDVGGSLYGPLLLTVGLITVIYGVGFFLLAVAALRSAILPRTPIVPRLSLWMVILAVPLALGFFVLFVVGSIAGLIFSLGLIGWGYGLQLNETSTPKDSVG